MFVSVSRSGRMILGRLERGDDLLKGLIEVCRKFSVRCAEVRAIGALSEAVLTAYDQKLRTYETGRRFFGDLEIVSLLGNVTEKDGELFCHLHASLARSTDNGLQMLGGHLLSGQVFACEFVLQTCDDLILRRLQDKETGLALWKDRIELRSEQDQPAAQAGKVTWDDVLTEAMAMEDGKDGEVSAGRKKSAKAGKKAAKAGKKASGQKGTAPADPVSDATPDAQAPNPAETAGGGDAGDGALVGGDAAAQEEAGDEDWVEPVTGDIVNHPKFGRCVVEFVEEDEFVHVRLPSGRMIRLSLEVVTLSLTGYEEDHQIFEARLGKD